MHLNEYAKATGLNAVFVLAIAMILPVLAPHIKSMGFNNIELGVLFSFMPLAIIFTAPIIGRISDDLGRRIVILAGIAGEIVALLLYAYGTGWIVFAIARILDAIAATTVMMAALSKIEDTLSNSVRGKYAGISLSIEYAGRLFGPVLGGLLADRMFIQAPFLTAAVILLVLLILLPKNNLKKKRISKKEFDLVGDIREFLSYRQLKGMAILGIVMHATFPAFTIFLPLLIVETFGLSYAYAGYAYFALGATHILQFVFGRWSDKKAYRLVLLGTLVSGMFMGFVFLTESYIALIFALFFIGLGNSMWNVSAWTLMSDIGEKEGIEGTTIGSYVSIAKIGAFLSFLVSGFLVQAWGINALFLVNGIIIVLGAILAYPLLKD